ncbi:MAG: Asp23/Gls24 family envelope stress response protein [Candidatus Hydrogenedentes bacterium]|nr:Asp23/Gls24 family envelope stress response protein [Candidatus Hydrogenedentota bacterium]
MGDQPRLRDHRQDEEQNPAGPVVLGKHEVDLMVYAKVAAHEASRQPGVVRLHANAAYRITRGKTPGVTSRLDEDGMLHLDISLDVRYGTDLRDLGPAVQEAVLNGIRRMSDQPVGDINVYVIGIEFGEADAQPAEERNSP